LRNINPNPDKPEPKSISRKAAKDAKEIPKTAFFKPNALAVLCELSVFARKFLSDLRGI